MFVFYQTTILINLIISRYFQNYNCIFILNENNRFQYSNQLPIVVINVGNSTDYSLMFNNYGCQGIIIDSKQPEVVLKEVETHISFQLERFNKRRYLILVGDNGQEIENIFQLKQLDYIVDLLVVKTANQNEDDRRLMSFNRSDIIFEFFTHKYVGFDANNEPVLINKWFGKNQSFLNERQKLYPDKLTDQFGRKFRISTISYPPYAAPDENNNLLEYYGSELTMVIYFAKIHNMTPVIMLDIDNQIGDVFGDFNGTGVQGTLLEDNADIGIGSLEAWEVSYNYLDFSVPSIRSGVTALVPAPKMVVGLLTPVYAFGTQIWLAVGCTFIISIIVLSLKLYCYHHNRVIVEVDNVKEQKSVFHHFLQSILIVYKVFLSQSITDNEMPEELYTKIIVTLLMVFGLLITSSYSSGYSSIMTIPRYEKAIDTVEDLINSHLQWAGDDPAWVGSIEQFQEPEYKELAKLFVVAPEDQLRIYAKTQQFGFAMERLSATSYAIDNFIKRDTIKYYRIMKDDIYWSYCLMMVRKSSVLLPELDRFILNAHAGGLVIKLHDMAIDACLDFYVNRVLLYPQKDHDIVKLNWSHVVGPFTILFFGHILSSVVFIIEIFLSKSRREIVI